MDNKTIKKILTLDQLVKFCQESKLHTFSSQVSGYTLAVQIPAEFEKDVETDRGMLTATVKVCHTLLNRNGSFISEENMKKAMPTLKYRPFLAAFIQDEETGEWDFDHHNMEIITDEETGEQTINYIERQIGCFTADEPYLEYDEKMDKTYVISKVKIPEEYSMAADIIRRKNNETKVSCELTIEGMQYNAKEKRLELEDFYFSGCTALGEHVGEGMLGSKLSLEDFSSKNNSMFTHVENSKLIETLEALNETLSNFNINSKLEKGGKTEVNRFEELLNKYGKTLEDITFEYEGLSDEELEAKFAAEFEDNTDDGADPTPTFDGDEGEGTDDIDDVEDEDVEEPKDPEDDFEASIGEEPEMDDDAEPEDEPEDISDEGVEDEPVVETASIKPEKYSIFMSDGTVKEFSLTLDEINNALYQLVNDTYAEADDGWYGVQVYEDGTLIMIDWWNNKAYRQSYKREEDNFSLVGDRTAVRQIWVTDEEEASLNEMKSNYSSIIEELSKYQSAEIKTQREAILYDKKYSVLAEKDENDEYKNEEFAKLVSEMDNYSLTDLEKELKSIFADYITNGGHFALASESEEKTVVNKKLFANPTGTEKKSGRYGNLFKK